MKVNGVTAQPRAREVLVFERPATGDIAFEFRQVNSQDLEDLEILCPRPPAPGQFTREGFVADEKDKGFQKTLKIWRNQRNAFVYIRSLEPSNIEWDSVNEDDCNTWLNFEKDIRAVLSPFEVGQLVAALDGINSLSEARLEAARQAFFTRAQQSRDPVSIPPGEAGSLVSGPPVAGSELSPPESPAIPDGMT
jgi:hypothetical protein